MKSFNSVNINQSNVKWKIGIADGVSLDDIPNDNFVFKNWSLGKNITVNVNIENFTLGDFYQEKCNERKLSLGFSLTWYCRETSLRGSVGTFELCPDFMRNLSIEGVIPGDQIAGTISLFLSLTVLSSRMEGEIRKGLKLGEICRDIFIEGRFAQFPMQIVSFSESEDFRRYGKSMYKLQRDCSYTSLEELFYNNYKLYLNSDSPYIPYINGDAPEKGSPERAVLNLLISSVYREIVYDIAAFFNENTDTRITEWYVDSDGERKPPEMIGSVFFSIIQIIASVSDRNADEALDFIKQNPDEAANILQASVFMEK